MEMPTPAEFCDAVTTALETGKGPDGLPLKGSNGLPLLYKENGTAFEDRGKIVHGVLVPTEGIHADYTAAFRRMWINQDKRAKPNRFAGDRIAQNPTKVKQLKARDKRLRKFGWSLTGFVS